MKTNLIVHNDPQKFNEILKDLIEKHEKENYIIRDIKYQDCGERYSALIIAVKIIK